MQMASLQHETDQKAATSTDTRTRNCSRALFSAQATNEQKRSVLSTIPISPPQQRASLSHTPTSAQQRRMNFIAQPAPFEQHNEPYGLLSDTFRTDYTTKSPPDVVPNCSTHASEVPLCPHSPDHHVTSASTGLLKPPSIPSIKIRISIWTVFASHAPTLPTIKAPAPVTPHGVFNPPVNARHMFSPKHASFASPMDAPTASSAKASMQQLFRTLNAHAVSKFESLLLKGAQSPPVQKTVPERESFQKDLIAPNFVLSDILRPPLAYDAQMNQYVSTVDAGSRFFVDVSPVKNAISSVSPRGNDQQRLKKSVLHLQCDLSEFCATARSLIFYGPHANAPCNKTTWLNVPLAYEPPVLPIPPKPGGVCAVYDRIMQPHHL